MAPPEDGKEINDEVGQDAEEQEDFGEDVENETSTMEAKDDKEKSSPATLLWVMKRLLALASREAAYSPKDPLKVCMFFSENNFTFTNNAFQFDNSFRISGRQVQRCQCKWYKNVACEQHITA